MYVKQFTKDNDFEDKKLGEVYGNWTRELCFKPKDG